jgi:DNA processing protein
MSYTKEQKACIWLNNIEGLGLGKKLKLMEMREHPYEIFANLNNLRTQIIMELDEATYDKLVAARQSEDIQAHCDALRKNDVKLITFFDEEYPTALKEIDTPPILLYCKGDISLLGKIGIGVVGTRTPTRYGVNVTEQFCEGLVERGVVIVSGLARGIDAVAHNVALKCGGETIAVLGSGIDVIYPFENRSLYKDIAEKGLLVSEYKMGTRPNAYQFPERNRLISAISKGVLVTEAGIKSGSLITADCAIKQGRDLFLVPGNITSKKSEGVNMLLKSVQGAMVTDVNDIFEALGIKKMDLSPESAKLDMIEEFIVNSLREGEKHLEELLALTDMRIADLTALLVKMELFGIIIKLDNNYYGVAK